MALSHPVSTSNNINMLAQLALKANRLGGLHYAGDIAPQDAYEYLAAHDAVLADVRTPEEWQAGMPDLKNAAGKLLTLSWKLSPNYELNTAFAHQFAAKQPNKNTPVFFLCRSGGRSLDAAVAMTQAGYEYCFNISGGFEGKPGNPGWKDAALPWNRR